MSYRVVFSEKVVRKINKLDKPAQRLIYDYIRGIESLEDPRSKGKALSHDLAGFWRYRVLDYRIICEIDDEKIIVFVVGGHRKYIYI